MPDDFLCAQSLKSCPILCDLMDCSLPGSSVHGILQLRILSWVAIPGDLPHPGTELSSSTSPALQADALPSEPVEAIKPLCKVVSTK